MLHTQLKAGVRVIWRSERGEALPPHPLSVVVLISAVGTWLISTGQAEPIFGLVEWLCVGVFHRGNTQEHQWKFREKDQ